MPKKIKPENIKIRATCVLYSWLESWGITAEISKNDNYDLLVNNKKVLVCVNEVDDKKEGFDIKLDARIIADNKLETSLTEIYKLTESLGYGKPNLPRPINTDKKAKKEDHVSVSLRLTPFSRTPNIPASSYKKWMHIVKRESDRAYRKYSTILRRTGMDKDDLKSIGMIYLTNFLSRHRDLKDDQKSGAHLTLKLIQEFSRWSSLQSKYIKNIDPKDVPISFCVGKPVANSVVSLSYEDSGNENHQVYSYRLGEEEEPIASYSKEVANKKLNKLLSSMEHDKMISTLTNIYYNKNMDEDVREEAYRKIDKHKSKCKICSSNK